RHAEQLKAAETIPEAREALAAASLDNRAAPWVIEAVAALRASRSLKLIADADENVEDWAAIAGRGVFEQESARSCYTREVLLEDHLNGCAQWANRFARELSERLQNTVLKAASLHDIGKADPRFQAWLRGGHPAPGRPLLAKSGKPLNSTGI